MDQPNKTQKEEQDGTSQQKELQLSDEEIIASLNNPGLANYQLLIQGNLILQELRKITELLSKKND